MSGSLESFHRWKIGKPFGGQRGDGHTPAVAERLAQHAEICIAARSSRRIRTPRMITSSTSRA
jgi:hypothetical protein